jgi:hypothetical protein
MIFGSLIGKKDFGSVPEKIFILLIEGGAFNRWIEIFDLWIATCFRGETCIHRQSFAECPTTCPLEACSNSSNLIGTGELRRVVILSGLRNHLGARTRGHVVQSHIVECEARPPDIQ